MSQSKEYDHVTFPLSITPEEKEAYALFCKTRGQTMSGRIKELMRKDIGSTVLLKFQEGYQKRIISSIQNEDVTLIVKSRQMWISEILLSCVLDDMIRVKHENSYNAMFIFPNENMAKRHSERFAHLCEIGGIGMKNNSGIRVRLEQGPSVWFSSRITEGMKYDVLVLDEFAFHKMGREEFHSLCNQCKKVIISSTPKKDSLFNSVAIDAINEKFDANVCIAHWSMNSNYSDSVVMVPTRKNGIRFNAASKHVLGVNYAGYAEEMECALDMSDEE